jgi:tetratricopeptide (TPR) repeat protein
MSNLAILEHAMEKYADAEMLYWRALEGSRETLGAAHPSTLTILNNLAVLLQARGRHQEAEPLLRDAVKESRATMGIDHPDTLTSLDNLGMLLQAMGKAKEAESLIRECLQSREAALGPSHPNTLVSLNNLAVLLEGASKKDDPSATSKHAEAEKLYRRALEGSQLIMGKAHPDTLQCMENLALFLHAIGNRDEAEDLFDQVCMIEDDIEGNKVWMSGLPPIPNLMTIVCCSGWPLQTGGIQPVSPCGGIPRPASTAAERGPQIELI